MLAFFQTLRGKLILTYTLVTILALLALEITVLLIGFVVSQGLATEPSAYLSDVVAVLPPQARGFLQADHRNLPGLQGWLDTTYENGYASLPAQGLLDSPAAPIVKSEPMYVIAPDGTVLAAAPASAKSLVGRKYTPPANISHSQEILDHAKNLDLSSTHLSALRADGNYLMAVPVQQNQREGPLVGVIIVTVKPPPTLLDESFPVILRVVPITGLVLLCLVAPFGALFGLIMSRGLTRRLKALTAAADAWSEGNFAVQPQDRAKDEISYLGGRMRRMAERLQNLLQTQQEMAMLEERNRLARELHDTVKQELFATLMQVRAAKNLLDRDQPAARKRLEEAEDLIKASHQELGLMITELRPAALEGKGLAEALGDYVATWSQHARIPVELHVENERGLPLEMEQALYRVAQEALANTARHSRASAVNVSLIFQPAQVVLCISDNGVGFDPQTAAMGFGLQSMHDRMEAIHGRLEIKSAVDAGAAVTAWAPANLKETR